MAEYTLEGTGGAAEAAPARPVIATWANWVGAGVSLALIAGVGVWGYKLLVRDVSGIPVVRAAEGPMRVAPASPGGQPAAHQGLAVNEVAGKGTAAAPSDRLKLAPMGAQLTDEDLPKASLLQMVRAEAAQSIEAARAEEEAAQAAPGNAASGLAATGAKTVTAPQSTQDAIAAAVAEVAGAGEEAGSDALEAPVQTAALGGVVSPRPRTRPEGLAARPVVPASAPQPSGPREVDPASIPPGTRLVQLGAYESAEVARAEWARFAQRFDAYLDGKDRVIEKASSGGRTFYRLRAMGFADLSDARRFCAALVAENADCIPVTTR